MLEKAIKEIEKQQEGKDGTHVFCCGEDLKEILRKTPQAAELVLQDLEKEEMSIEKCAEKIKELADSKRKGNFAFVSPAEAESVIRQFYGIPDAETQEEKDTIDLSDFL